MATPSLLSQTRVVLVHPFFPENIGSVARAMDNSGLDRLVIAEPGSALPDHPNAHKLASHATSILERAQVVPSLEAALEGVSLAVGTTQHAFQDVPLLLPREAARLAARHVAGGGEIALVFGNEKNGLTREAMRRCHQIVRIPTGENPSLNLSQAVMIMAYEWLLASMEPAPAEGTPATGLGPEVDRVAADLAEALQAGGFFKAHNRSQKEAVIRRVLSRALLEPEEASLFRGLAHRLGRLFKSLPAGGGAADD
ncbi:MAG TPA: TrmH family RNA methyltransferase [Stenomitos sp.]